MHRSTGRIARTDVRDRVYTLTHKMIAEMVAPTTVRERIIPWHLGPTLDQGQTPECVVYAFAQFLQSAPRVHTLNWLPTQFLDLYYQAQELDEISGPHDGTTARAMMKVAQQRKLITAYYWIDNPDVLRNYLHSRGGVMVGTEWWGDTMFNTDSHGYVEPEGENTEDLGHEYFCRWYYPPTHYSHPDSYEFVNSWNGWGYKNSGRFFMKSDMFEYLLFQRGGDAVLPIETSGVEDFSRL